MTAAGGFFNRVLVPVDGSASALKAARFAIRMACLQGCELHAVHVVDESAAADLARFADRPVEAIVEKMRRGGEGFIAEIERIGKAEGVEVKGEVRVGVPHRVVLTLAAEMKVDLIVMGKVGRKGPRRVLIGSVTERVIEHSRVPVLVVK